MNTSTLTRLSAIIQTKLGVTSEEVTGSASLTHDLGADSIDVVQILMEVEREFNITINTPDDEGMKTVGDILEYIDTHGRSSALFGDRKLFSYLFL